MKGQPVGLPITLALPIYSCNFTPKGSFGQGGRGMEIQESIVPKIVQDE
jgi:hypothetical protein